MSGKEEDRQKLSGGRSLGTMAAKAVGVVGTGSCCNGPSFIECTGGGGGGGRKNFVHCSELVVETLWRARRLTLDEADRLNVASRHHDHGDPSSDPIGYSSGNSSHTLHRSWCILSTSFPPNEQQARHKVPET